MTVLQVWNNMHSPGVPGDSGAEVLSCRTQGDVCWTVSGER